MAASWRRVLGALHCGSREWPRGVGSAHEQVEEEEEEEEEKKKKMKPLSQLTWLLTWCSLSIATLAKADSVSPSAYNADLNSGGSVTVHKTVTIDAAPSTTAPIDVFLLADTTGSMGSVLAAVRSSALSIVSATSSLGDVRYGVGEYKDFGDVYVYRTNTGLTNSTAQIQSAVNLWFASGGGDIPEANLYGLKQVADTVAWRPGSTRILVWFGDAPGHDPSGGVTESTATAALVARVISVEALDVFALNSTGQAARIAAATGGHLYSGTSSANVASVIINSIRTAVTSYSRVSLDLTGVPSGVTATSTPAITGSYNRGTSRTFEFDVTFTGVTPGTYNFEIPVLVDGGRVVAESDTIRVASAGGGPVLPVAVAPSCALTAIVAGPPKQLIVTVQDADDGLRSVEVTVADNTDVLVPTFSNGEKGALVIQATKVDAALSSQLALRVTDAAGNVTECDPIVPGELVELDDYAGGCSVGSKGKPNDLITLLMAFGLFGLVRRRRVRA